MAFRRMISPVQVSQLFCIPQLNFLPLYKHFNTGNQSFVLVVPPLTHTLRCFLINSKHVYRVVALTSRGFEGLWRSNRRDESFAFFSQRYKLLSLRFYQCKNLIPQNWSSSGQLIPAKSLLFSRSVYPRPTANTTGIKLTYFWGKSVGVFSLRTFLP